MQFWMPCILSGFSGFMLCASVQHIMATFLHKPLEKSHAIFSLWALMVFFLSSSICFLYNESAEKYFTILIKSQACLSVLTTAMLLVFSVHYCGIRYSVFIKALILGHVILLLITFVFPYGGFLLSSTGVYRPDDGLMAGKLTAQDGVLGWPLVLFSILLLFDFAVAFYGAYSKIHGDSNKRQVFFYTAALAFYFLSVVVDAIISSTLGAYTHISLLGVGSMVFFMGSLLSTTERENLYEAVNSSLEDKVGIRTREIEGALAALSEEMRQKEILQSQLIQAKKMESIGQLAGGFAHDFNNVLTSIRGYGELSLDEVPLESELHQYIEQIIDSTDRASQLTSQLLGVARKQRSNQELHDVNTIVTDCLKKTTLPPNSCVHFAMAASGDLPSILLDRSHFQQIWDHLIANALDAMPDGGQISVSIDKYAVGGEEVIKIPVGVYIRISISDTGCGIDADVLGRIFEPFFTTKPSEKSGLGLAVCYGLIKQNSGYIFVSNNAGKGTRVDIYFRCE